MDAIALLGNLLDPAILFFFFGLFAIAIRSTLEIPAAIAKFLSLYLLLAIGYKGGLSLAESGITLTMVLALLAALIMSVIIPAYAYMLLRNRMSPYDAAATAATYGSVSAVTFIAAMSYLDQAGIPYGGYMTVALVIMESPAIIMAVFLANYARQTMRQPQSLGAAAVGSAVAHAPADGKPVNIKLGSILHEAFTDGAHVLLLGALAIGTIVGLTGTAPHAMTGFVTGDVFKGFLALFLLEMGLLVGRKLRESGRPTGFALGFATIMPLVNAVVAAGLARAFGLPLGDAVLLVVLSASASYIVVPAVVRYAIPEANPSTYFTMSIAITFPFNLAIGIPLYVMALSAIWGA